VDGERAIPRGAALGTALGAALLLLLVAALLHGPRLTRPFGLLEGGGDLYGTFHRVWDEVGFTEARGLPMRPYRYGTLSGAVTWTTHPPGLPWISGALATREWAVRLPTLVGAWLAAVALFLLLRGSFGAWPALVAALLLLLMPMVSLFSQMSYEDAVLPAGLWLYLAVLRARARGPGRRAWWLLVACIACCGPWIDWAYAFYGLGLLALVGERSPRRTFAALWFPAACGLGSLALLQAWRVWATQLPGAPARTGALTVMGLLDHAILRRPPAATFMEASLPLLTRGFTLPLLVLGLLGLPLLWRRLPRLTAALLVPGVLFPLVFAWHSSRHYGFFNYLSPLVAAGAVALLLAPRRLPAPLRTLLCTVLLAGTALAAARWQDFADVTFYRDLGRELDAAAEGGHAVLHNSRAVYPYYVHSPHVRLVPVLALPMLEAAARPVAAHDGLRMLWLHWEVVPDDGSQTPVDPVGRRLKAWLEGYPSTRVPVLEQSFRSEDDRTTVRVREARLFTIREPAARR
jgi:hypothetical protein